jgi:hypothetical protein
MKIFTKTFGLFLLASLPAAAAFAQTQVSAEIRPRSEYRHGYKAPADSAQGAAVSVTQRSRLYFTHQTPKFRLGLTLQDVRVWGNQSLTNAYDVNTTSLHEGYAEYMFTNKFSARLGRQELSYNDERILGASAWSQQSRSHDLVLFKYADSTFTAHAGFAYNQNAEVLVSTPYTITGNYKQMQFLWLNKKTKRFDISLLVLGNGVQSPVATNSTRYSVTAGTHIEFKQNAFGSVARFYYQDGVDKNKTDLQGMMAALEVSYTVQKKMTFVAGGEYFSGQSQTDTSTAYKKVNHAFNPMYGTAHKFNGLMDYFYVGNHFDNVGLQDYYVKAKYKAEKWSLSLDVHEFFAAAKVLDQKTLGAEGTYKPMDSRFGTEIDCAFSYNVAAGVTLAAGYGHFLTTPTISALKGVTDWKGDGITSEVSNWGFVMITFKPALTFGSTTK